ncbi:hypothetical protein CMO92_01865, partial [Candidatus Woesearchaeota archaeon]|nr:hypothetical protein [Candidatus Woesearchaeota archaeon]
MPHSTKKKKKRFRANIDQQDSEFAEEFKETCQLNGAKRTLSRLIPAIVEQIDDKAHNRTGFDLHDRPQFHQNLESYLAQMMPHHSLTIFDDEQNPFRYLMRKSIEICIEGYQDKRRKNGDDYAIYHPTGLARGIDSLLKDKDLPTYYVMAAIKGALFHDFGEDIYFKPR